HDGAAPSIGKGGAAGLGQASAFPRADVPSVWSASAGGGGGEGEAGDDDVAPPPSFFSSTSSPDAVAEDWARASLIKPVISIDFLTPSSSTKVNCGVKRVCKRPANLDWTNPAA